MKKLKDSWEFNVLGVYNYNSPGKLEPYYQWIVDNHNDIDGDILEAGVFNGKSLLATALLLKDLNSNKKVYGFDSFSGFPPVYHKNDNLEIFKELFEKKIISEEHYIAHKKLKEYRSLIHNSTIDVKNISSSIDFSDSSEEKLVKKINFLELDNIVLVKGSFEETMVNTKYPNLKLMAALMDCDLYSSYKLALPYIWKRLELNGYIYLDEYYSLKFSGARIATNEFVENKNSKPMMYNKKDGDFERWSLVKNDKD